MSRIYHSLRPFLGSPRLASRVPSGQTVRIERVKVKRRRWFSRLVTRSNTITFAAVFTMAMLMPAPSSFKEGKNQDNKDEVKDKNQDKVMHHEDDDEYDDDDDDGAGALFFPFPLTLKKHPPEPYSGRDPEWREFVRISRDRKTQDAMRSGLAGLILQMAQNTPRLVQAFGPEVKLRRWWLDIDFPYKAPPTYECSGFLFTPEEGVRWVTMECDPEDAQRMHRSYWPRPLAMGVWAFGKQTCQDLARSIAASLGFATSGQNNDQIRRAQGRPAPLPATQSTDVQKAIEKMRQQTTRQPEKVDDPRSMSSSAGQSTPVTPSTPAPPSAAPDNKTPARTGDPDTPKESRLIELVTQTMAWEKFKRAYSKEWIISVKDDYPRGGVLVSGLVELETTKAWIVYDVAGWYDPTEKQIDQTTLKINPRRMQPKQQGPMR
ncbi:hypothetical protein VTI74DRAFT_2610 [Chaetomium olivicolor]